ncbi:phage tail assembly chaperone G [Staphylococcus haemolyticus]|uniref:phage tail assembly chaperone G n=1 Tax=Staphylococcus haemolyticus TaxID=1283 RepID=UPI00051DF14A|nr:hypothetical protein [Staphylococcus haemolyticus]KGJ25385.1 phage protein [Staphylococcus haemolyticus]KGJ29229.1 phage protein [Staphylococcus haemolyticus]
MIKFVIKNNETGKTESYKKDFITMGEAEKCYEYLEAVEKEREKSNPDASKMRKKERELLIFIFKGQGLTDETILNYMSTKAYTKAVKDIFREVNGDDEEDEQTASNEAGKTEK